MEMKAKVGDDIVLTKWIALEGTSVIAKEKEELLKERFPHFLLQTAKNFDNYLSIFSELEIAEDFQASFVWEVSEGGIYAALWNLVRTSEIGFEVDLKAIPVRQETVEICEYFRLNPYQLRSNGCALITINNSRQLIRKLEQAGIPACCIGSCVDGKAKSIITGEDIAHLERPKKDELYKICREW